MFSNFGTKFQIGSGATAPYSYTDVFGVFLIPAIEAEQEKIEVTHHDQSSRYREYIPTGLISPGDNFPVQMRSKPSEATQQAMFALYKSGDLGHFRIVRPDGFTQTFDGYVADWTYNEAEATSPDSVNITAGISFAGDVTEEYDTISA